MLEVAQGPRTAEMGCVPTWQELTLSSSKSSASILPSFRKKQLLRDQQLPSSKGVFKHSGEQRDD